MSLPKTGNHNALFTDCGMTADNATKAQITQFVSKMMVQFLVEYEDSNGKHQSSTRIKVRLKPYENFLDINIPEFSWSQIRTAYNTHADEVYGNPTDLTSTIFAEDADAFFEWCDSNGDGEVSLWESASCGAKAGFWQPEGKCSSRCVYYIIYNIFNLIFRANDKLDRYIHIWN